MTFPFKETTASRLWGQEGVIVRVIFQIGSWKEASLSSFPRMPWKIYFKSGGYRYCNGLLEMIGQDLKRTPPVYDPAK